MEYKEAKEKSGPIRDNELEIIFQQDIAGKLEEQLVETPLGKRIKVLEALGLDISVRNIVEQYIEQEGNTLDRTGNPYLEETALLEIYTTRENAISEILNIDISKITDLAFLQKAVSDIEHKKNVEKYGVWAAMEIQRADLSRREELKEFYDLEKDYGFLFKVISYSAVKGFYESFNSFTTSDHLMYDMMKNPNLKMDKNQIEEMVKKHEKNTVDSNIENKDTVKVLRSLYKLRTAVIHKDLIGEKESQEEIKEALKEISRVSGKAQYTQFFTDENGDINIEKAIEFLNDWETARNDAKIFDDMSSFSKVDFSLLNRDTLPKILISIQRAQMGESEENKKLAKAFAEKLRKELSIDLFSGEDLDSGEIEKFYEKITDGADIYFEIEQAEWNEFTASDKLDRVDDAIDLDLGTSSKSRDQINDNKESMNKLLQEKKADKKFAIEQIIKKGNYTPEQIVALFYEFRYKEVTEKGNHIDQFDGRQLWNAKEHGTAEAIMTYMLEHPEQFKEYIKSSGSLNGKQINELISRNEFSNEERNGISNAFYMIENTMTTIDRKRAQDKEEVVKLLVKLESYRGILGTDISSKEKDKLFRDAKKLYSTNSLSKAVLRDLVRIDKERFKQMHKEVEKETNGDRNFGLLKTMSNIGKNLKKTISKERKKEKENGNKGILKGKIDTMTKKISEVTNRKKEQPQNLLPVEKKNTIFDTIRNALFNRNRKNEQEAQTVLPKDNSDKEKQNPVFEEESLTGDKNSDKTVVLANGMDYLKVGYTPTYKQETSKTEQDNSKENGVLNPEEQEIGE